eukprot:TRINITY_DN8818_c0_g3_i1.p1 TRINITY_DN8818_c0_g3~~TRINITY_DN8818_c0_g3_i1.p1  ORF type:complete len:484 (+),score=109.41 TRINITY_DN8818_c0_g3_i1:74-1453(+)
MELSLRVGAQVAWDSGDEGDCASAELTPRTRAFEEAYARTPRGRILGRGAFGVAFLVYKRNGVGTPRHNELCVAKEIRALGLGDRERREALAESEILRTLAHRNVVACLDTMLTGSCLYIVMEYASGGDLAKHLRARREEERRYPEGTIISVFAQVCRALRYVHGRKILHRDLKPANIFVFGDGELAECEVKLGDFGLGKVFDSSTLEARTACGSPAYFSPEICKGVVYGRKSDVWSLGVILYELACLSVPFNARLPPALAVMICTQQPKPLPDEYGDELRRVVSWILQRDPRQRPSAAELMRDAYVRSLARPSRPPSRRPSRAEGCCSPAGLGSEAVGSPSSLEASSLAFSFASPASASAASPASASEGAVVAKTLQLPPWDRAANDAEQVLATFRSHDVAGRGTISEEVLLRVLVRLLPELGGEPARARGLVAFASADEGGFVDYMKFLGWLYNSPT